MKNQVLAFISVLIFFGCQRGFDKPAMQKPSIDKKADIPQYEEGVLLVKYKTAAVARSNKNVLSHIQTAAMKRVGDPGFYKVKVDNVKTELARMQASPDIEEVSLNYTRQTQQFAPNDPYYTNGSMWGIQKMNVPAAWNSGNFGDTSIVWVVIDEGCQYWHCDLNGKSWVNEAELNGQPGVDDDNNGYVDDVHGYNFYDNTAEFNLNVDHSTHVTGTICAKTNNGIGVPGVAPNVTVMNLQFLADYGYDDNAVRAIDYAIDQKHRGVNIRGMNFSWGGGGENPFLRDAMQRAANEGILIVCAAGNSSMNIDTTPFYPASYKNSLNNVLVVGAMRSDNQKSSFSNYGQLVDVFAPGENIWSTLPAADHINSTYGPYSGTSMAAPNTSGVCILYWSMNPDASYLQVIDAVKNSVIVPGTLTGYCQTNGYVNAASFTASVHSLQTDAICGTSPLNPDYTPPPTPQNLRITGFTINDPTYGNSVRLEWDTIGFFNPLTDHYNIWWKINNGSFSQLGSVGGVWAVRINGLQTTNTYSFYIVAESIWGAKSGNSNTVFHDWGAQPPAPDLIPPTVNILTPPNGYTIPSAGPGKGKKPVTVSITISATDNIGVTLRQILIDGVVVATNTNSYNWNTKNTSSGTHTITAKAYDAANNMAEKSISVYKN